MTKHRTNRIYVLVTDEQFARIKAAAEARGQEMGPWVRGLALDAVTVWEAGK